MRMRFSKSGKLFFGVVLGLALFSSGYVAGQNRFGQPKTILHMVAIKWNPGVSDADKQKVLDGVKDMAGKVPGVKNIWIKPERLQPRDLNTAFVITSLCVRPAFPYKSRIPRFSPKAAEC